MSQSSGNEGSRRWLKFENKRCICNKKAAVRISESELNPYRLYYNYPDKNKPGCCDYFSWCKPTGDIIMQGKSMVEDAQSELKADAQDDLLPSGHELQIGKEEFGSLKHKVKSVNKTVEAIRGLCQLILAMSVLIFVISLMKK